jgi:hypothetical protein
MRRFIVPIIIGAVLVGGGVYAAFSTNSTIAPDTTTAPSGGGAPRSGTAVCGRSILTSPYTSAPSAFPGTTSVVTLSPGSQVGVTLNTANTTYFFPAGTYTFGLSTSGGISPGTNDVYVGAAGGSILSGQFDNNYAFEGTSTGITIVYLTVEDYAVRGNTGTVNGSGATGWTMEYDTIEYNVPGHALYAGSNNTVEHDCLTENGQGAFGTYTINSTNSMTGHAQNVNISNNEISFNNTCDWDGQANWASLYPAAPSQCTGANGGGMGGSGSSCGCAYGGKFYLTLNSRFDGNYVHDNYEVGVWYDDDDAGSQIKGNYIANNYGSGLQYEISVNALIEDNTFVDNGWGQGVQFGTAFPEAALYISDSSGEASISSNYSGELLVENNVFTDNWGTIDVWHDSGRFCGNPNVSNSTLCVLPYGSVTYGYATGTNPGCGPEDLTGARLPSGGSQGTAANTSYYVQCGWLAANVTITGNTFHFNSGNVTGCTSSNLCGSGGLFSDCNCNDTGGGAPWDPYTSMGTEITTVADMNNVWSKNIYVRTGSVNFEFTYGAGVDIEVSIATWQANGQDSGSSFT